MRVELADMVGLVRAYSVMHASASSGRPRRERAPLPYLPLTSCSAAPRLSSVIPAWMPNDLFSANQLITIIQQIPQVSVERSIRPQTGIFDIEILEIASLELPSQRPASNHRDKLVQSPGSLAPFRTLVDASVDLH